VDCLGVNHYFRSVVSFVRSSETDGPPSPSDLYMKMPAGFLLRASFRAGFEKSDMGWDMTPSSLERVIQALWDRYAHGYVCVRVSGCLSVFTTARLRQPEPRVRLAVRGVPKGGLRTHSASQAPLWGSLVTCVEYCLRVNPKPGFLLRASFGLTAGFEKSDMGWDMTPSSLERIIQALWDR